MQNGAWAIFDPRGPSVTVAADYPCPFSLIIKPWLGSMHFIRQKSLHRDSNLNAVQVLVKFIYPQGP